MTLTTASPWRRNGAPVIGAGPRAPPPSGGEVDHTTAITNPKVRAWNTTRTKGRLVLDAALARWARADVNQLVEAPGLGI